MLMTSSMKDVKEFMETPRIEGDATWQEVIWPKTKEQSRGMVAALGVGFFNMASGITVLLVFSGYVLSREMAKRDVATAAILFSSTKVLFLCIAVPLLDTLGRYIMLIGSCVSTAVSYLLCGLAFNLGMNPWIKVAMFCCVTGAFSLGLGSATYVFIPEVFDNRLRGKASSLVFAVSRITSAIIMGSFVFLEQLYGVATCFYTFSVICFLGVVFMYLFVPETKQLPLEQVHLLFTDRTAPPFYRALAAPTYDFDRRRCV